MRSMLAIFALLLTGCGAEFSLKQKAVMPEVAIDRRLGDVLKLFVEAAEDHGASAGDVEGLRVMQFVAEGTGDLRGGELGGCRKSHVNENEFQEGARWTEVSIARDAKDRPLVLKWAVFHELGHCLLGLDHEEEDGHIMSGAVDADLEYSPAEWDAAVEDLFETGLR